MVPACAVAACDQGELVAAVAVEPRLADSAQVRGELAQEPVAVLVAELVVDELEVGQRNEHGRERLPLLVHERDHGQELLAVGGAGELVDRQALVLQVQVDDEQRARGRRPRQQIGWEQLLHGYHAHGDEREHGQDALDDGVDGRPREHHERETGHAVEVEHQVGGYDERPLHVGTRRVEGEQAAGGDVRQHQQEVRRARHAARQDEGPPDRPRLAHNGHGVVIVHGAQQRREHEVAEGHEVGERQQLQRRIGDHERRGQVRADSPQRGGQAEPEHPVLRRRHRMALARVHGDDEHDDEGDDLSRYVPSHVVRPSSSPGARREGRIPQPPVVL